MKTFNELMALTSLNEEDLVNEYLTTEDPVQRKLLEGMIGNTKQISEEDNPYTSAPSDVIPKGYTQETLGRVFSTYTMPDFITLLKALTRGNPKLLHRIVRMAGGKVIGDNFYFKNGSF